MISFKEFNNEPIPVFCNAGGYETQYDKFNTKKNNSKKDDVPVFCNAGGPPQKDENLKENLNPRTKPLYIKSSYDTLSDPEKSRNGIGTHLPDEIGIPDHYYNGHVHPHFTTEQAKNAISLVNNTQDDHEDYHPIISNYTQNSYNLNSTLFHHYLQKTQPPRKIKSNLDDEDSEIDIHKLDNLISRHKLPHDMTVYSGMHFHPNEYRGRIYVHPSYMSTSVSPHVAKDFGMFFQTSFDEHGNARKIKNILRLNLPKGHAHLFTDNGSHFPGQGELILPRGLRFQLGQRPTHIVRGNFNNHFSGQLKNPDTEYHFYNGRILRS